ncbi:palmdelphin-like [Sardina pilchardus]|uniref:palmdelphin-like n=1 Tax=Sardina pilchardus TaxID=27697 RepID=UPI002E12639E
MEEAGLLKERLQAITDKRRVQEDIAKKRRQIEEEKLKLQYLKKKALREQWLMDGLSGQTEEEQEALKTQAQDDQQQTELLQSNISRIEEEIEALEAEEIRISSNEQRILKRLKEVEKTAEDIIKELNADIPKEPVQYIYSPIPDMPKTYKPSLLRKKSPKQEPDGDPKRAMFAMEISVELDKRTGESQVLSSTTITTDDIQSKGVKVFDDGRKSVYALSSDGRPLESKGVDELSPGDVEELLRKAEEKKTPPDVQLHEPVFSSPYSRPNTPRKSDRDQNSPAPNGLWTPTNTPSPLPADRQATPSPRPATHSPLHIPDPPNYSVSGGKLSPYPTPKSAQTNGGRGTQRGTDGHRVSPARSPMPGLKGEIFFGEDSGLGLGRVSPLHSVMEDTRVSMADTLPSDIDPDEPVTMIFMGYRTAEQEEEDEGFQAELIVIGDEDEEHSDNSRPNDDDDSSLSFHPEGYRSKVFSPSKTNMHRSEVRPSGVRNRSQPPADIYSMEDPSASALRLKMAQLGKQA